MNKQECEQIQDNITTHLEDMPDELIDELCDVVVNYYNKQKTSKTKAKATIKKRAIALEKGYTKVKNKIAVLTKKSNAIEEQIVKFLKDQQLKIK